jgi:hypothetical protein
MKRFDVSDTLQADCTVSTSALSGTLYHFKRNAAGGALLTPVARYFGTQPEFVEGYNKHWRLDCYFRDHKLSPEPLAGGEALVVALMKEGICTTPLWLSVHRSEELKGKAYGQVFEEESEPDT